MSLHIHHSSVYKATAPDGATGRAGARRSAGRRDIPSVGSDARSDNNSFIYTTAISNFTDHATRCMGKQSLQAAVAPRHVSVPGAATYRSPRDVGWK